MIYWPDWSVQRSLPPSAPVLLHSRRRNRKALLRTASAKDNRSSIEKLWTVRISRVTRLSRIDQSECTNQCMRFSMFSRLPAVWLRGRRSSEGAVRPVDRLLHSRGRGKKSRREEHQKTTTSSTGRSEIWREKGKSVNRYRLRPELPNQNLSQHSISSLLTKDKPAHTLSYWHPKLMQIDAQRNKRRRGYHKYEGNVQAWGRDKEIVQDMNDSRDV